MQGKSSGGFGAMITPMLRPDLFGGLATHAGDTLYEHCYLNEFAKCARYLRPYDGDIFRWWDDFQARAATNLTFTVDGDQTLLMVLGCTAAFSAADDGTPELRVRPGQRRDPRRAVAALARLGPGPDGADLRRRDAGHAHDLDRRRHQATSGSSTSARRRSGRRCSTTTCPRSESGSSSSTRRTWRIDYRYPMSLAHLARTLHGLTVSPTLTAARSALRSRWTRHDRSPPGLPPCCRSGG